MKKKSLLILPVLLLALAACNKEEEEVEPEDNTPEVTQPSGDDGDGSEKEQEVDTRITLTEVEVTLNSAVTYANPSDGSLSIDKGVVGEDGSVTYTVTGTAPTLSAEQAADFWSGHAKEGDKYIVINVAFNPDEEAVSWVSSAGDTRVRTVADYPDGSMDVIIRISGKDVSEDKLAGTATYTIGQVSADGSEVTGVDHIVDFTALFDTRITLGTGTLGSSTYENDPSLSIASVKTDEDGNVTYVLSGKAGEMTSYQANDFWPGVATAGNKFIVVTVTLKEGESVSANSSTPITYEACGGEENYIIRLTGTQTSGATSIVFTITDSGSGTVTHTIDFSALLPEVEEE